jgi:hypothetical protein
MRTFEGDGVLGLVWSRPFNLFNNLDFAGLDGFQFKRFLGVNDLVHHRGDYIIVIAQVNSGG